MHRSTPCLAVLAACLLVGTAVGATHVVMELSNATLNEEHWMRPFDAPATAVADFNGDGKMELVAHNDNQYVYVMSATSTTLHAEFRTDYPSGWGVRPINDPVVADVDNDGKLDIIVVNSAAYVCVYEYKFAWSFEKQWCKRMSAYDGSSAAADAGAAVADVNGDGKLEIFSQTEKLGLYAYNWDGTVRWSKGSGGGNSGPLVTDLDGDGKKEVLFFSDGGTVRAIDASSGSGKWSFWSGNYVKPASIPVSGNAADLDNDGKKEVVFSARHAPPNDSNYQDNNLMVFVLSSSGSLKARYQPSWGNPMSYTHPILIDVNGDGKRDILMQDWNTIGHKPGDWERLGPANVFALKYSSGALSLIWRTELDNSWSNDDLAVADVDGDGAQEVLAIGPGSGGDGVWYLSLRTGVKEQHVPIGSWTALRGPVVGDLNGDGKTWWAIPIHRTEKGGAYKVFRTDAACNVPFGGWAYPDPCGDGPDRGSGGGGGVDPTTFSATFNVNGGNEWWVDVRVSANQPLAGVDARVNGGAWKPLTLRSWGEWAASIHAPPGSQVQFQARSSSGGVATSGCYQWTGGTAVTCGSTATFSATFSGVDGNNWWVQVSVKASGGTLAGVDARVNGGAWIALTKQSWGAWAKSFHVPDGSMVDFRARSTDGATATSGAYRWPPP